MLETEIKKLTAAIEALTAVIEVQQNPQMESPLDEPEQPNVEPMNPNAAHEALFKEVAPKAEKPKAKTSPAITHEEVKELCLKISRADRSKKPAIKALIAEYGANVVTQVATESLAELKAKLEGLE